AMDYGFTVLNLYKLYLIVDESVKPAVFHHYTIKNRIDYY
ncbi:YnfC family lipoprotein, partial [Salmonella enterica subsp. enterica serovar Enteritidis]|nr:YnfC family lipoprotein [Salmonella enterica subsp. enterica serovar Enteritidis]